MPRLGTVGTGRCRPFRPELCEETLTLIGQAAGGGLVGRRIHDTLVEMLDRATPLIFSATAVAIGFKMNLFNIGVEGQYRMAAIFAAYVGGAIALPGVLHIAIIMVVAMLVVTSAITNIISTSTLMMSMPRMLRTTT